MDLIWIVKSVSPSTISSTATPVIRYFLSSSRGLTRTQAEPPRLCPTSFNTSMYCLLIFDHRAHHETWSLRWIGEDGREKMQHIICKGVNGKVVVVYSLDWGSFS